MPVPKKEVIEENAKRLGIDIKGMPWGRQVSVVTKAMKEEAAQLQYGDTDGDRPPMPPMTPSQETIDMYKRELAEANARIKSYRQKYENYEIGDKPTKEDLENISIEVAPEITPGNDPRKPKYAYEEKINKDVILRENDWYHEGIPQMQPGDSMVGGVENMGYKERDVVAISGGPRSNAGIKWIPGEKFLTVYKGNQDGYLWHQVRQLLKEIDGGRFYEEEFFNINGDGRTKPGKLFMLGNRYAIDKVYTNNLVKRIEKECKEELYESLQ